MACLLLGEDGGEGVGLRQHMVQIITIFSNWMLDWCRNLQQTQDGSTELTLIAGSPITHPQSTRNLMPPKFVGPNERRLNSDSRRGIKTHFAHMARLDKETQTTLQENPAKVLRDCCTQTTDIVIHPLGSRRNSTACSRLQSPASKLERTNFPKAENCATERTNLLEGSKGTLDCRNEHNRETKASYNMLESQERAFRFDDRSYHEVRNVESYHYPPAERSISVPAQPIIMRNRLPHRQGQLASQRMVQSIRNTIEEEHDSNTFSQKYKTMLRNVESEFKLSEKKHSERKIRFTPEKRILFQERETIISKYGESYQEEKSMRVEESLVYDRDVRSFFTTLGRVEAHGSFVMFLALENTAGAIISIKQTSVRQMGAISEELLVYREMEEKRLRVEGILELYQTQIDRDSYLFIKEPYTSTLAAHIRTPNDLPAVDAQARGILVEMEQRGFTLKTLPRLEDFVVCFDTLKIQNPGIFEFEQRKKIEISSALLSLKDQILEQLH